MRLEELPVEVLARVLTFVSENEEANRALSESSSALVVPKRFIGPEYGRAIREAAYATLVETTNIQDDDNALYEAENALVPSLLGVVLSNEGVAQHVKKLVVLGPPSLVPLDDEGTAESLVKKLTALREMRWLSSRAPGGRVIASLAASGQLERLVVTPLDKNVRWDALGLSTLPSSLTSLRLASLSAEGAKELRQALVGLGAIESLVLEATPYIDDAVLEAVGRHSKRLKHLTIKDMLGTKLTDAGIAALAGAPLVSLTLENVEGRLTRTCWSGFRGRLERLTILFLEDRVHKSWVADHLQSVHECITDAMTHLEVTRILSFDESKPKSDVVRVRTMPDALLDAITTEHGKHFVSLVVNFWSVPLAGLKSILESIPRATKLSFTLDDAFKNIVTLGGSVVMARSLREMLVSVPAAHIPQLVASPSASPTVTMSTLPGVLASDGALTEDKEALLPPAKELKRFFRKSKIELFAWVGHTALGEWHVSRQGLMSVKVDFVPYASPSACTLTRRCRASSVPAVAEATVIASPPSSPSSSPLRPARRESAPAASSSSYASMLSAMASPTSSSIGALSESEFASMLHQRQHRRHGYGFPSPINTTVSSRSYDYHSPAAYLTSPNSSTSQASAFSYGGHAPGRIGLGLDNMSEMLHSLDRVDGGPTSPGSSFITGITSYNRDAFASAMSSPMPAFPPGLSPSSTTASPSSSSSPSSYFQSPFASSAMPYEEQQQYPYLQQQQYQRQLAEPFSMSTGSSYSPPDHQHQLSPGTTMTTSPVRTTKANAQKGNSSQQPSPSSSRQQQPQQQRTGGTGGDGSSSQGTGKSNKKKKKEEHRRRLGGTNIGYQRGKPRNKPA